MESKKYFGIVLVFFLTVSFASAFGVTHPFPQSIELKPGQSSFFSFQIQADNFPLKCVPVIEQTGGLELAFNQEYNVEANQRFNVKPQVIVPKETGFGTYSTMFCMECVPSGDVEGSRIVPRVCNIPLEVSVVSERTGVNAFEESSGNIGFISILAILSISILVLVVIIFYIISRRKISVPVR